MLTAVLGQEVDGKGGVVAVAVAHLRPDRPLLLLVHRDSGPLVWDIRCVFVCVNCSVGCRLRCTACAVDCGVLLTPSCMSASQPLHQQIARLPAPRGS